MGEIGRDVATAVDFLQRGEVVAIPTETVYGLAGNALNPRAVARIFAVKNRPSFNPLIIHTDTFERMQPYVHDVPPLAYRLAERFWPGPLTLLLRKTALVPDIVTAGSDQVAVRIPRHPLTQQLLAKVAFPLAAPSANPSGYVSPTQAKHVVEQLGEKIPYILDGGPCAVGVESTIIGFEEKKLIVYREGGVSTEQLQEAAGDRVVVTLRTAQTEGGPLTPGRLSSHYAPRQRVVVGDITNLLSQYPPDEVAIISFRNTYPTVPVSCQIALSATGDLSEAAQRLFAALRQLEKLPVTYILAEWVPEEGIGRAINDRLRRSAAKK